MRPAPWQVEPKDWSIDPVGANQHPGGGAHAARHQHRLADLFVVSGQHHIAGAEGARGAFAVHADAKWVAVDIVVFELGHVVGDVIDLAQVPAPELACQNLLEGLSNLVGQHLAVAPGEIGRRDHGPDIVLSFDQFHRRARQLAIGQLDAVLFLHSLQHLEVVGADLMAQPTAAAVDLHHDLSLEQAHGLGRGRIEDLVDDVDLGEVVARAERADLRAAAFFGPMADLGRVRAGHRAVFLGVHQVFGAGHALFERPACAGAQHFVELLDT